MHIQKGLWDCDSSHPCRVEREEVATCIYVHKCVCKVRNLKPHRQGNSPYPVSRQKGNVVKKRYNIIPLKLSKPWTIMQSFSTHDGADTMS